MQGKVRQAPRQDSRVAAGSCISAEIMSEKGQVVTEMLW